MANVLKRERQIEVLSLLSEGCSIRSVERHTGVHRDTVMRLLCRFGDACRLYLDAAFRHLSVRHAQLDEIWTFVAKKEARLVGKEKSDPAIGDIYLFTALDAETKLLFSHRLGKRNGSTTEAFVADMAARLHRAPAFAAGDATPQVSTDGFAPYVGAIRKHFGQTAKHGVLVKNYVNPEVGRYAPPDLVRAERHNVFGITDLATICTSHVERCNLTIRTFIRRFTRLALGFSKKLRNLEAAALHVGVYNFVRVHQTLGMPPALAAGVCHELMDLPAFYDAVQAHAKEVKQRAGTRRLIERLRRPE
jgi:IS1 family transposase